MKQIQTRATINITTMINSIIVVVVIIIVNVIIIPYKDWEFSPQQLFESSCSRPL